MTKLFGFTLLICGLVVGPHTAGAQADGTTPGRQGGKIKANGFLLQFHLGTQVTAIGMGVGPIPLMTSGFITGYKLGRVILGLRLEVSSQSDKSVNVDNGNSSTSINTSTLTSIIFAPVFQFHLIERGPLALFLGASVEVGPSLQNSKAVFESPGFSNTTKTNDELALVGFSASFGLRYFLASSVALSVEAGLRGFWIIDKDQDPSGDPTSTNTAGALSVFGLFGVMIVM